MIGAEVCSRLMREAGSSRQITQRTLLYTEMIVGEDLLKKDTEVQILPARIRITLRSSDSQIRSTRLESSARVL